MPRFNVSRLPILATLLGGLLAACVGEAPSQAVESPNGKTMADGSGTISMPRMGAPGDPPPSPRDMLAGTNWSDATVGAGQAWISCDADYTGAGGDGRKLKDLQFFNVLDAMDPCRRAGVLRLRYQGKIDGGFADLVARVAAMAERMEIGRRILDLDSAGGHVEDAIRAGDAIGKNHWTLWVREGSVCHSACVLILAAGDNRLISGAVGIHRMIRMSSTASTRQQLNDELRVVHGQLSDYLQRNGAAVTIADLMMTVPSRSLRMLTHDELQGFGLTGANAVQQDLERIRLARKCGSDFLARREGFQREFETQCLSPGNAVDDMNHCAQRLHDRFGFPDAGCPDDGPMAEIDAALPGVLGAPDAVGAGAASGGVADAPQEAAADSADAQPQDAR